MTEEVKKLGRWALAVATYVGQQAQVAALIRLALEPFGAINVLIIDAGICLTGAMTETFLDGTGNAAWLPQLLGMFYTSQVLLKAVWEEIEQRRSDVVVGAASLARKAYKLAPGLRQWMIGGRE